jgi:hypothetical protein
MSGIITLYDRVGNYITSRTFKSAIDLEKIISTWQKIYGKGFQRCETKIEYSKNVKSISPPKESEAVVDPKKSQFKKGKVVKMYKVRKTNRGKLPNMDAY